MYHVCKIIAVIFSQCVPAHSTDQPDGITVPATIVHWLLVAFFMFLGAQTDSFSASLTCLKASPHDENTANTFRKNPLAIIYGLKQDAILFLAYLNRLA